MPGEIKQLFFSKEEREKAIAAAKEHNQELYKIFDRRTKADHPLMFVLTLSALERMYDAKMMKRMWTWKIVASGRHMKDD